MRINQGLVSVLCALLVVSCDRRFLADGAPGRSGAVRY
jgi:hypothetical protein